LRKQLWRKDMVTDRDGITQVRNAREASD
jgi:hypothetical protein